MEIVKSFEKFMLDNGLLFEINRKVLHPLGLAISANPDPKSKKRLNLCLYKTDDLDGFLYDEEGFEIGAEKFEKYLKKKGQEKINFRMASYGFIEQKEGKDV